MRVTIDHKESTTGLLRRKTLYEIHTTVQFSSDELNTIRTRKLSGTIVLERRPGADKDGKFSAYELEALGDAFDLKIGDLAKGADVYRVDSPLAAKTYDAELKDALKNLKAYLEGNAKPIQGSTTFEL